MWLEDGPNVFDGFEVVVCILVGCMADCMSEGTSAMDEAIFWCEGANSHGWVPGVHCVQDNYCLGVAFYEYVALLVVEGWASVESIVAMEVP